MILADLVKPNKPHKPLAKDSGELSVARIDQIKQNNGNQYTAEIRKNMQKIMQNDAAVFRTQSTLEEGCKNMDECVQSFKDVKVVFCQLQYSIKTSWAGLLATHLETQLHLRFFKHICILCHGSCL